MNTECGPRLCGPMRCISERVVIRDRPTWRTAVWRERSAIPGSSSAAWVVTSATGSAMSTRRSEQRLAGARERTVVSPGGARHGSSTRHPCLPGRASTIGGLGATSTAACPRTADAAADTPATGVRTPRGWLPSWVLDGKCSAGATISRCRGSRGDRAFSGWGCLLALR